MGGFTLLEHTADVGVEGWGESLEEALAWLATGLFSLMVDLDTVAPRGCLSVSVRSRDRDALVVDWLNELIYQYETVGFLVKECQVSLDAGGTALRARCRGEPMDQERHRILTAVKAATYHRLEVAYNGEWRIQVILDV